MEGTPNPERRADVTENATWGVEEGGAEGGANDEVTCGRYCGEDASTSISHTPAASSPQQVCPVPEQIASVSPIGIHLATGAGELRNPDITPARSEAIAIPAGTSLSSDLSSVLHSVSHIAEGHEKLSKGYRSHCVRDNIRHTRSVEDMRSLSDSFSSQQDHIEALEISVAALQEEMRKMKAKFHHNQKKTSTHLIPYDSMKDEQAPYNFQQTTTYEPNSFHLDLVVGTAPIFR